MSLTGKHALVTGGGRGIGRAIAIALAQDGAKVAVTGRSVNQIESVAKEIGGIAIPMDLADRKNTDAALAHMEQKMGPVDILVNNAGISNASPIHRASDEDWDQTMEVNVTAVFRLIKAVIPHMVTAKWGRIINVASNAGLTGYAYTHAYCASKHALVGLTRSLAAEVAARGITVNALCPGWVETDMAQVAIDRISDATGRSQEVSRKALEDMSPQQRMITAEEVGHMARVLCSDASRGIHGQTIVIDGGTVMK